MIYLLDANVLIDAHRDYYPYQRVPEFWEWLVAMGGRSLVKVPVEIIEEFTPVDQEMKEWVNSGDVQDNLVLEEGVDVDLIQKVTDEGYAGDLTDEEIETVGRDPFLISYALVSPQARVVVTTEASKPRKKRANRKVPDVCRDFGITSVNTFHMIRALNFSTHWK